MDVVYARGQQICPFELFPVFNMAKGGGLILIVFFHLCVRVCVASTVATTSETKMIIYYMYSYNLLLFSLLPSCWLSREGTYMPAAGPFIIYIVRVRFRFFGFLVFVRGTIASKWRLQHVFFLLFFHKGPGQSTGCIEEGCCSSSYWLYEVADEMRVCLPCACCVCVCVCV